MPKDSKTTLTPKLRFPEFQDEPGWQTKRLDEVCTTITQGGTPDTSVAEYWNGDVCWLTPAEMGKSDTPFVDTTERKITEEGLRNCSSTLLPINTVILSTRAPIGHLSINRVPMAINQGCKGLIPSSEFDFRFLYFRLLASRHRLNDLGSGNTFKELSGSALKTFSTTFPRQAEQQKIAECLSTLDELIEWESRKLDALKDHKKGLMQQLFPREGETRPRLRFPAFRDAPEWAVTPLREVCSLQAGRFVRASEIRERYEVGLYPCYGGNGLRGYTTTFTHDGAFPLVGRQGALCGNVKFCTGTFHATEHALVATPKTGIDAKWLYYALDFLNLNRFATGQAQPGLSVDVLEKVQLTAPGKEDEQHRIASCLSSFDDLIAAQSDKLEALRAHKRGLMQRLFPNPSELDS